MIKIFKKIKESRQYEKKSQKTPKMGPIFSPIMQTDGRIPSKPEFFFLGIKTKNLANMTLDIYMEFQIHKVKLNIFKQKNRPKNQFYVFFLNICTKMSVRKCLCKFLANQAIFFLAITREML